MELLLSKQPNRVPSMQGVDDSPVVSRTLQVVATTMLLTQPSASSSRLLATMMRLTIEGCTY